MDIECSKCGAQKCVRNSRASTYLREIRILEKRYKAKAAFVVTCDDCGELIRLTEELLLKEEVSEQ